MPTQSDKTGHALSVAQLNAIDALVSGATDSETAAAVGVTRQTVNVWRNRDPAFQAELNRRRRDIWGHSTDRLRALIPQALGVLEGALAVNPDPALALKILQLAGVADPAAPLGATGPTTAAAVIDAEILRRRHEHDPIDALLAGGPITCTERAALVGELTALAAGEQGSGAGGGDNYGQSKTHEPVPKPDQTRTDFGHRLHKTSQTRAGESGQNGHLLGHEPGR